MNEQLQSIDMPRILRVEQSTADSVMLWLQIDPGLNVFKGHFDQLPVLPGIVQLHWALALCGEYLRHIDAHEISHIEALKFQHVIQPGTELTLALTLSDQRLGFRFSSSGGDHSSGRVVLD